MPVLLTAAKLIPWSWETAPAATATEDSGVSDLGDPLPWSLWASAPTMHGMDAASEPSIIRQWQSYAAKASADGSGTHSGVREQESTLAEHCMCSSRAEFTAMGDSCKPHGSNLLYGKPEAWPSHSSSTKGRRSIASILCCSKPEAWGYCSCDSWDGLEHHA